MTQAVQDKIVEIIAEQAVLDPSEVSVDMTIEELGLDSLGLVEAVFAIEENFEINVPFNANDPAASEFDITSVKSMIDAVNDLIKVQNG
jgi:acyl carrier protein